MSSDNRSVDADMPALPDRCQNRCNGSAPSRVSGVRHEVRRAEEAFRADWDSAVPRMLRLVFRGDQGRQARRRRAREPFPF